MFYKQCLSTVSFFLVISVLTACSESDPKHSHVIKEQTSESVIGNKHKNENIQRTGFQLNVHKSPTCGCCEKWIEHLKDNGFQSKIFNESNMSVIKDEKGVHPQYRSCHTAISNQGFVFEGHVPAKYIQQFLSESHDETVIGLSVPAMPLGSPGMEVDDRFQPYKVLLLKFDGSYEVYADINSSQEQF